MPEICKHSGKRASECGHPNLYCTYPECVEKPAEECRHLWRWDYDAKRCQCLTCGTPYAQPVNLPELMFQAVDKLEGEDNG